MQLNDLHRDNPRKKPFFVPSSGKKVNSEMSLIRENIRPRENDRRMAHHIGIVLPREDDLPPIESHFYASPKVSPKELASRISSAVIRTLPGPNGSTLSGKSHGISWTRPEGVEIVIGSLVFTTRRAMPLKWAFAFETVIVFISTLVYSVTMLWSSRESRLPNQRPEEIRLAVMPAAATLAEATAATGQPSRQPALMPRP